MNIFLVLLSVVLCYFIGRGVLRLLGIGMIGSLGKILVAPMVIGIVVLMVVVGIIGFIFKCLFILIGWFINAVIACIPGICVICIIYIIIRFIKRR